MGWQLNPIPKEKLCAFSQPTLSNAIITRSYEDRYDQRSKHTVVVANYKSVVTLKHELQLLLIMYDLCIKPKEDRMLVKKKKKKNRERLCEMPVH